jgi:hypothetical protein
MNLFRSTRYVLADPGVDPLAPVPAASGKAWLGRLPIILFVVALVGSIAWAVIGSRSTNPVEAQAIKATITATPTTTLRASSTPTPAPTGTLAAAVNCQPGAKVYATVIVERPIDKIVAQTVQVTKVVAYQVTKIVEVTRLVKGDPLVVVITQVVTATPTPVLSPTPTPTMTPTQTPTARIGLTAEPVILPTGPATYLPIIQ